MASDNPMRGCDQAIEAISEKCFVSDYGHWISYLLEGLDEKAAQEGYPDEYERVLRSIRDEIDTRLSGGSW